jgi:hypothetical protein
MVSQLSKELENSEPPASIYKLAQIPFKLLVSTTWDTYLERALNTVRFGGISRTVVPPYGLGSKSDLSDRGGDGPVTVFPLFGRANPSPDYAVTDEDILEFVHQFQVTGTPRRLLETLRQSHLLLIGGCFSDWLTRFLIRVVKTNRLWTSTSAQRTHFFADRTLMNDERLLTFLQHPLSDVEVFPVRNTDDFVDELHSRWSDRHPTTESTRPDVLVTTSRPVATNGGVFVSYASEDFDAAARMCDALDRVGIDVWFDKRDLRTGDDFEREIATQIARSYFFIVVISQHSLTHEPRFFRFEWREAERRGKLVAFDQPYILPVVIDDTPATDERIPTFVRTLQWTRAPAGEVEAGFVEGLVEAYRRVQRPLGRA